MKHNLLGDTGPESVAWPAFELAEEILERLSGFLKYPENPKGRIVYVEALQKCVSEKHARAVIDSFDSDFPSLRELRSTVLATKRTFEPEPDFFAELRRLHGCECPTRSPDVPHLPGCYFFAPPELEAEMRELFEQAKLHVKIPEPKTPEPIRAITEADLEAAKRKRLEGQEGAAELESGPASGATHQ